jgi:ribose transport system ATP-binding protein
MRQVHKRFGPTVALAGVDLTVMPGEVRALIGENGAGKSTLMKILSGAHRCDSGEIWLDGKAYSPSSPADGRSAGIAMIYQELSLAPHLSVAENILLGMEPTTGPWLRRTELRARASAALAQIEQSAIPLDVPVSQLSQARQQLVEVARGIACGSRVLVLDEPTSSLAQPDVLRLFDLVRRLQSQGLAVVYISHFLEEIQRIADTFTVVRDGCSVGHGDVAGFPIGDMVRMMVGRELNEAYPRTAREAGEPILELSSLSGHPRPDSASLQLRRGEVVGIAGVIGAGRTELVRAIFGLDPVRQGTVRVGTCVGNLATWQRWQQGVGLVSEDRRDEGLATQLDIAENVTLPPLHGRRTPWISTRRRRGQASRPWITRLGVKCHGPSQPVEQLSGGNQQKVALARLLYADVDVMLLDEPTRGIDIGSKRTIYELIDRLACGGDGRPPRAILFVSSYLPELLGVCDRISVMCRGKLGPCQPVASTNEHQIMLEATGTESTACLTR